MLHHRTKQNGKVDIWDATDGKNVEMFPTDALHAMKVDPERYMLDKPEPEPDPEPEPPEETEPLPEPETENDETHDG